MIARALVYAVVTLSLFWSSLSFANPRIYPDDVFDELLLLFDIADAFTQEININDENILINRYPGRALSDFDRNQSGSFTFLGGDALLDLDLAIQQFTHDSVDYDQDGLLGFYELECKNANRAEDVEAIILRPTLSQSVPGENDGDQDCDGDGISNLEEIQHQLDPLDYIDGNLDSDADGIINRDEALIGSNPFDGDSDQDGISDAIEIGDINNPLDEDNDGILDVIDDDCDVVAEADRPLSSHQSGVCQGQQLICDLAQGGWRDPYDHEIDHFESIESTCDGLDNDCDGQVDELIDGFCELSDQAVFLFSTVMTTWETLNDDEYSMRGGSIAQAATPSSNAEYRLYGRMMMY